MFERFTNRARAAVVRAQQEARDRRAGAIETEHILSGLLGGEDLASEVIAELAGSVERVREALDVATGSIVAAADAAPAGHIPFTPRAKKVLELSLREALKLGHNYIGTEHLLLALLSGGGTTASVLGSVGIEYEAA